MNIKIKTEFINDEMKVPTYAHDGDAGVDLQANIAKEINIPYGQRELIPTGIFIALPKGSFIDDLGNQYVWELQIRPRSGLAHKYGITIVNTPGTIDSHYRGQIHVNLLKTGREQLIIKPGDRIAQGVLSKAYKMEFEVVEDLDETERGTGGHGSTGI